MAYPVQNTRPAQNNYPIDDTEGFEDPYDFEGANMGFGPEGADSFEGSEAGGPSTVQEFRTRIQDLQAQLAKGDLSDKQKAKVEAALKGLLIEVNFVQSLNGKARDAKLLELQKKLAPIESAALGLDEGGPDSILHGAEAITEELTEYRAEVEKMSNLTETEKTDALGQIDKWLTEIKLNGKDSKKLDIAEIESGLESMKDKLKESNEYTPGVKGLADKFDIEPDKLKAKAKAKGIDMDKVPNPPTKELLDFLMELSPDLKEKFKKVEEAVAARTKEIETQFFKAKATSDHNSLATTDSDQQDVDCFQKLFDLRHHQDEKSNAVKSAMQEATKELIDIFKSLYPGTDVKAVEPSGLSGWQKIEADYNAADKIRIGNNTVDFFAAKDGKIQSMMQGMIDPSNPKGNELDPEAKVQIPALWYDGEGDGEWSPPVFNTYGDSFTLHDSEDFGTSKRSQMRGLEPQTWDDANAWASDS